MPDPRNFLENQRSVNAPGAEGGSAQMQEGQMANEQQPTPVTGTEATFASRYIAERLSRVRVSSDVWPESTLRFFHIQKLHGNDTMTPLSLNRDEAEHVAARLTEELQK